MTRADTESRQLGRERSGQAGDRDGMLLAAPCHCVPEHSGTRGDSRSPPVGRTASDHDLGKRQVSPGGFWLAFQAGDAGSIPVTRSTVTHSKRPAAQAVSTL